MNQTNVKVSLYLKKSEEDADGNNTGAFFRVENYHREFSVPKTGGPNAEVFALRVIFSRGLVR